MLAIATPAATDDNWKFQQQSTMSRPPPASVVPSVTLGTPHRSASRDGHASHQPSSTPMVPPSSSSGTVVPSAMPHSTGSGSSSSPAKPLGRSKSRGSSVGGFVHGIVNGVQASLRNVGHKSVQSVPANGYHSDHPPPSKPGHFKTKPSVSPTNSDSPEGPTVADRARDQTSPVRPFNKALARSQSRGRAYESEGDNHTIGSIRHTRPSYPPISTNFATPSSERVAKPNGHTHIPLSPLSRESSTTQSITAISSALSRSSRSQSQSPPSPNLIPPSYTIRGPVSRSAARAILELDAIPPTELLKVLATLLEQIAAANDALRAERAARGEETWDEQMVGINAKQEADLSPKPNLPLSPESPPSTSPTSSRSRSQRRAASESAGPSNTPIWNQLTGASKVALSSRTATLSFHARHVPQISLEAYLIRILKYCPTANATFVAVLVYFDRMCRLAANVEAERVNAAEGANSMPTPVLARTESNGIDIEKSVSGNARPPFAIDSYNVHRLVIAGVTVASKFFSDVFYTNSRYAKVGGLPQAELNQLELQFLLLNDFSLVITPEELARYAAQLITYAQGRGVNLKPEGLGKGKLGREAKIVLGLEVETEPEPDRVMETSTPSVPGPYTNGYGDVRGYHHNGARSGGTPGMYRSAYTSTSYTHDNYSGMDITHDSETEVSTDEDSTIKARSGSESEASEWGVGSTEDEGEVDGGETETEGDDDDSDEDVGFYERRLSGDLAQGGSESRTGRPRSGTPGGTKVMDRRQR